MKKTGAGFTRHPGLEFTATLPKDLTVRPNMEHAGESCNWAWLMTESVVVAFVVAFAVNWFLNRWRKY